MAVAFGCIHRADDREQSSFFTWKCPAAWYGKEIPAFPHVVVKFVPKRTTSILQPLDLSIIAGFKNSCPQKVAQRVVDLIDESITQGAFCAGIKLAVD